MKTKKGCLFRQPSYEIIDQIYLFFFDKSDTNGDAINTEE